MSAEAISVNHTQGANHVTMERIESLREPADQASCHNRPEKDWPEPDKKTCVRARQLGLLPDQRRTTPPHPSTT